MATLNVIRRWALREQMSIREISKRTGLARNTVKKYLRSDESEPTYARRVRSSMLDPYAEKLANWLELEATKSRKQRRNLKQIHTKLIDTSLGLAWRPTQGRLNLLAKAQYLYDLAPTGQINVLSSQVDQESTVYSAEATYELNPNWELAGKLAHRNTATRLVRGTGPWFSNNADYAAAQVRWHFGDKGVDEQGRVKDLWHGWSAMAEYRTLNVERDGRKQGALVSLDKDLGKNLRLGVGYNFTDFSSDLTQLQYKSDGWFVNLVGRF